MYEEWKEYRKGARFVDIFETKKEWLAMIGLFVLIVSMSTVIGCKLDGFNLRFSLMASYISSIFGFAVIFCVLFYEMLETKKDEFLEENLNKCYTVYESKLTVAKIYDCGNKVTFMKQNDDGLYEPSFVERKYGVEVYYESPLTTKELGQLKIEQWVLVDKRMKYVFKERLLLEKMVLIFPYASKILSEVEK